MGLHCKYFIIQYLCLMSCGPWPHSLQDHIDSGVDALIPALVSFAGHLWLNVKAAKDHVDWTTTTLRLVSGTRGSWPFKRKPYWVGEALIQTPASGWRKVFSGHHKRASIGCGPAPGPPRGDGVWGSRCPAAAGPASGRRR